MFVQRFVSRVLVGVLAALVYTYRAASGQAKGFCSVSLRDPVRANAPAEAVSVAKVKEEKKDE